MNKKISVDDFHDAIDRQLSGLEPDPWLAQRIIASDKEEVKVKTLRDAKIGETVVVAKIHGTGGVKRRIMDMGITKNVEIYVRKVAPLGDPMELTVRGYELSLRKADAEMIEIK